jgi:pimeloyl-ACP methyl ester carboxylesterase
VCSSDLAQAKAIEEEGLRAIEEFRFHPRYAKRFPAEIKRALLADAARLSPKGIANAIRYTRPELSVLAKFEKTLVPTLLVNGLRENAFQPLLEGIKPVLRSLKVVDLDGGHSINIEAASSFNEVVKRFMTVGSESAG